MRNDPRYIEARDILLKTRPTKATLPKSPKQHNAEVYGKKGITLFITTILGTISLTQAVLSFDWITMLTYFFVLTIGIIFGIIQMGAEEIYWTEDYWKYAKMEEETATQTAQTMANTAKETMDKPANDTAGDSGRVVVLESSDSCGTVSPVG